MKPQTRWEQAMYFLDELPPWQALGSGVVVFFGVSMAASRLPPWGFAVGTVGIAGLVGWLLVSGKPRVQVTWPQHPSKPSSPAKAAPAPAQPVKLPSLNAPLEMIDLPGGEFWMGSPPREPARRGDEVRHRVKLSPFAMAKYPVTQKLYEEVMGENPSYFKGTNLLEEFSGDALPIENISWHDAVRFCNKLSELLGLLPCYQLHGNSVEWDHSANGYRLPTEAEWEYACRAGTATAYGFGGDQALLGEYAWFDHNSWNQPHEVGTKKPNRWGLHDLHGNVWEWCWDCYGEYRSTNDHDRNVLLPSPVGTPLGSERVVRGGSYFNGPLFLRSANRFSYEPSFRSQSVGFRCVRGSGRQSST